MGRDAELATIEAHLGDGGVRLLTLTGPGGIGKTRLAVEAAHRLAPRYRDGVAFVPLESLASAPLVVPAIAGALGLREVSGELMDGLASYLRPLELLLVLDNFEHVVDAATAISRLLADAPGVAVLVTSRHLLRLTAEHELPVPPLDAEGDGTTLFVERAAGATRAFELGDGDLEVVAEICRRLDGVPLAIELAASRMRLLTPAQLLDRLSARLALAGPRDAPARQRTLEAAIAWSYDLLEPPEQRVFERLSAFHGSFTLDAAEAVCAVPDAEFLDLVASLLDKSLVFRVSEGSDARFAMLSMIREYALGRLQSSGAHEDTLRRFADYYVSFATRLEEATRFRVTAEWRRSISLEADNLRAALAWLADHEDGTNLVIVARGLWPWFWMLGYLDEGRTWAQRALGIRSLSDNDLAWALSLKGLFGFVLGDLAVAHDDLERARLLHEQTGDRRGAAMTLTASGLVTAAIAGEAPALAELERAYADFADIGDRWGTAVALSSISRVRSIFADFEGAGELLERSLQAAEAVEDDILVVLALANLAHFHLSQNDPIAARKVIERAFALIESAGVRYGAEDLLDALARAELGDSAYERAAELVGTAEALREGMRIMLWGPHRERRVSLLADLEAALGQQAFDAAFERGRGRPLTYWTRARTPASA